MAREHSAPGLLRTTVLKGQNDPERLLALVVFESEEKARAREGDPRRQEGVQALRTSLAEVLADVPEYSDLEVLAELVP